LAASAPQRARPRPLGSRGPPALSQKAPPPVMRLEVRRAVTLGVVLHFDVPVDQQVGSWCSCVRCSECEPSIILKREEHEIIEFYGAKKLE
jgi:hypothetical protein